ncbi:MAG: EpsI family protein [gamma proteobacterium symbiont of Ctena orbiculata]|nr:MAG: EpsI family protein [gamma proteobacterium symbiont of Ctena orbiculata]
MKNFTINKEQLISAWPLFIGILLLSVIYHSSVFSIFDIWIYGSGMYSHGILLFAVACYILVKEWRDKRTSLQIEYRFIYGIILLFLSVAWLFSELTYLQTASQLIFIFLLIGFVLGLYGSKGATTLLIPIIMLLCAILIWAFFEKPLQVPTATLVDNLLRLTGYVSIREGYIITIPEGAFEVGDRCSGLRYQIAAVSIAFIYCYFTRLKLLTSIIYILSAIGTAFLSNVIRIYIVVLSGHYTNMTHSLLHDHIWLGWVVFFISFVCLFYLWNKFSHKYVYSKRTIQDHNKTQQAGFIKTTIVTGMLVLFAAVGPLLKSAYNVSIERAENKKQTITIDLKGWESSIDNSLWQPTWVSADADNYFSFTDDGGRRLDLYLAYYSTQAQGKEVINSRNRKYDEKQWSRIELRRRDIELEAKGLLPVIEELVQNGSGNKRLIWTWYYIGGNVVADALKAKLVALSGIFSGRSDATAILISTEVVDDVKNTKMHMKELLNNSINEIEQQIDAHHFDSGENNDVH